MRGAGWRDVNLDPVADNALHHHSRQRPLCHAHRMRACASQVIQMDNGEIETYNAFRVQHNNCRGPVSNIHMGYMHLVSNRYVTYRMSVTGESPRASPQLSDLISALCSARVACCIARLRLRPPCLSLLLWPPSSRLRPCSTRVGCISCLELLPDKPHPVACCPC